MCMTQKTIRKTQCKVVNIDHDSIHIFSLNISVTEWPLKTKNCNTVDTQFNRLIRAMGCLLDRKSVKSEFS
jgi:hypothetical protein